MTCPPYDDLSAYADHMLKPRDQERFAAHLAGCPVCRLRLDEISALRQSLRALPSPALGFDLGARLEDRLRAGSVRRRPQPFWPNWVPAGLAAAAMVSGVWLGGLLIGAGAGAPPASMVRVFDPVPPGGLCAAAELCRLSKGMP